jgi:hypothetical protein
LITLRKLNQLATQRQFQHIMMLRLGRMMVLHTSAIFTIQSDTSFDLFLRDEVNPSLSDVTSLFITSLLRLNFLLGNKD